MTEQQTIRRCTTVLIAILLISGVVNIITSSMLAMWKCPKAPITAKDVHNHSNLGLLALDESQEGDDCSCPSLTWTVLEVLVLTALVFFAISLAWRCGALTLVQFRQRAQQAERVRMEQAQLRLCKLGPGTVLIFYKSFGPTPICM